MHEHHDEVGTSGDECGRLGVDRLDDRVDLDLGDAGGAHERGEFLRHGPDESDLHVAELLDPRGGNRVVARGPHLEVRRDVLPLYPAVGLLTRHRVP